MPLRPGTSRSLLHASLLACALLVAAPASAQVLLKEGQVPAIAGLEVVEKLGHKIPLDLPLIDASGRRLTLGQSFNDHAKPVVLALVYFRCPMQCPTILNKMVQRFNALDWGIGDKYNVVIASFDPTETPADASKQLEIMRGSYVGPSSAAQLEQGLTFLTSPDPSAVRSLADAVGFPYKYLPESNEYSHGTVIFVLTPGGTVSRYLYGVDYPPSQLRLALMEASNGQIGTTVDRVIFWCFHYDPATGRYTVAVMRVVQGVCLLTLAGLGVLVGGLSIADRRRRASAGALPAAA